MLNDSITRTTGLKEYIYTNEPKQSVTEFKYASNSDRVEITGRNASIKVDKANASIEQIVTAVGDSNGDVTSASIVMAINDDTSNIKLEADKIDINGVVSANNNFKIKQDGSVEIQDGEINLTDSGQFGVPSLNVSRTSGGSSFETSVTSDGVIVNENNSSGDRYTAHYNKNDMFVEWFDDTNDYLYNGETTYYGHYATFEDTNNSNNNRVGALESNDIRLVKYDGNGNQIKDFEVHSGQYGARLDLNGSAYITSDINISGNAIVEKGSSTDNTGYRATRTDTNASLIFGIGSGGTNRGIYDLTLNKWLFYTDGTNVYLDRTKTTEITKAQELTQSDFISANTNYSIKHFTMNKLGNHIFGNVVIQATNNIGTSGVTIANVKSGYRVKTGYYTFCGLGNNDYTINGVGYLYVGTGGDLVVANMSNIANIKYVVIEFNYITA